MTEVKNIILSDSQILRRNLIVTFLLSFVLVLLYATIPGYNFAIRDVAVRNKEKIDQIETRRINANQPELTMEDKRLFKIEDYWYIQYLRDRTPTSAVILLPPHSAVDSTSEYMFLNSSEWMEYFLFPRLCISEDERLSKPALYARTTHVAIVNGWGYDHIKYPVADRPNEGVYSIEPQPIDTVRKANQFFKPSFAKDTTLNQ